MVDLSHPGLTLRWIDAGYRGCICHDAVVSAYDDPPLPRAVSLLVRIAAPLAMAGILAGFLTAIAGWRIGAFVMLGAVCLDFTWHLAAGIAGYRSVMRRPWPKVAPLDDDDEW